MESVQMSPFGWESLENTASPAKEETARVVEKCREQAEGPAADIIRKSLLKKPSTGN